MAPVITREEFLRGKLRFFRDIRDGGIFVHPTDTIYGLGCDATNEKAVKRLRELKQRPDGSLSVIAPSLEWIRAHCKTQGHEEWLERISSRYTLIYPLRGKAVAPSVTLGAKTLGVRIPEHWFSAVVKELGFPIITTSANIHGEAFMTSLENLDERLASEVRFIIFEGEKVAKPSTLVDLTGPEPKLIGR